MAASLALPDRFRAFVQLHGLIAQIDRIVVAVSGGVDSVVLLHLLAGEKKRWGLDLLVAHFNHQLRGGEADADEEFTRELAAHYGAVFVAGRGPVSDVAAVRGKGVEEAARDLRYTFLEHTRRSRAFTRIATGHNADDNLETVLLNLFRGSGLRGLAGIPVQREEQRIIRPLLFAAREEIAAYARTEGLRYRDDASNDADAHARNVLRHHVIPVVRSRIQPDVSHTVLRTSQILRELDAYVADAARTGLDQRLTCRTGEEVQIPLSLLCSYPVALRQYLVRHAAASCAGASLSAARTDALLDLLASQPGAFCEIAPGWRVYRTRENLDFVRHEEHRHFTVPVRPGERSDLAVGRFAAYPVDRSAVAQDTTGTVEFVDADRTGTEGLVVRSWRPGDRFVPLGMMGSKKISDFFVDAGIPAHQRHQYPVLTAATGHIVWLCGLRIDERFKITDSTTRVLRLEFQRRTHTDNGEKAHGER